MKVSQKETIYKIIVVVLSIGAILVNVKNAIVNYNVDTEYAVALSYRLVKGDIMFAEMWEPHQTSAFLSAFFIQLYLWMFGTTTGITLFLNFVGLAIKALMTVFLYVLLRKHVNKKVLYPACLFFFAMNPKYLLLPEFSNMQLWFSVLLFGMLFLYFQKQNQKRWLVFAAIALCLEVLSYPSCVIVYVGVIALLVAYSENKWKDILIFSAGCLGIGVVYVGYFAWKIGAGELLDSIGHIIGGDSSHGVGLGVKFLEYFKEMGKVILLLAVCALVSILCTRLYARLFKEKQEKPYLFFFLLVLSVYNFVSALVVGDRYMYLSIFLAVIAGGWWCRRACDRTGKMIYDIGAILSSVALLATLLLTNLTFLTSVAYMILGVTVSFVPIGKYLEGKGPVFKKIWPGYAMVLFCAATIFRSGFLIIYGDYVNASVIDLIEAPKIIQYGPSKGIVTDYFRGHVINESVLEWPESVQDGDRILLVSSDYLSAIGYLYADTEICTPSTICTPTYDERLLEYWEKNPEKYPNVVIVSCWDGDLKLKEDSWIMQWIETEFCPDEVQDGKYWRYYRKN